jgi:hypothetical protein
VLEGAQHLGIAAVGAAERQGGEEPAGHPPHRVQLPRRHSGQVARQSLSFHPPLSRYRSGFPENLGEEFDAPFVRLDWLSRDRFNIQWHRHTRTWFCLHRGKSLAQALKLIETDGILHRFKRNRCPIQNHNRFKIFPHHYPKESATYG